ncbi:tyrosine recombinase XerC [Massilia arenosa]|uniref:Tyrosine recombinase XerC n=1 Tax=Zemynaea arenosa TaxID=2561931 RepID=A0A4Y9SFG5_9BURK|nr:tyrosine recombinase XerC [Massilia arenosa]TFW19640.1 tyrosine recombinase XerC [Massilia arenosa]
MSAKADWVAQYLAQLRTQRKLSEHTVLNYGRDLRELLAGTEGKDWPAVTHADIRRLAAAMHGRALEPRSIARRLSAWRGFFKWLSFQIALPGNPVEGVRAPKRAKILPKALSVDDAVHLVGSDARAHAEPDAAELCNRAMFELMYSSGLRVSELAGLDAGYAREALGWIDRAAGEAVVTGKGNKMRRVPVGSHALAALDAWLTVRPAPRDGSNALFVSSRGTRISPRVVQLRLKAHALQVGTAVDVHPHVLRHSFASHVLQSSGDLRAVQEMLGHASIASTQVYTALDFQHLAKVYDQAHPRAKSK